MTPWRQMTIQERARWIGSHWRLGIPIFIIILIYMVMTFPLFAPLAIMPNIALLLVLLWSLYRPHQMPPWTGFVTGLAGDIFMGTPMGANALLMPIFMLITATFVERIKRETWHADWLFAIPLILGYHLALWRICILVANPIPFLPILTQALATAAVFPFIARLFISVQRKWAAG